MHSDDSSFGWESLDEEERSSKESEAENCTPEVNNSAMVKLEATVDSEESDNFIPPKRSKVRDNGIEKTIKTIKQDKEQLSSIPSLPKTVTRKSDTAKRVSFGTIAVNNKQTTNSESNDGAILDQYIKNNDLKLIKDIGKCDVTEEDDVWIVQCPRNIDISSLNGLNFLQKDKKKFKIGSDSYECVSHPKNLNEKISILVPPTRSNDNYKLNSFDLSGIYFIREKMNNINDIEVCEQVTEKVPFPTNLKKRHPLLGHVYKPLLKIPNSVKEKLNNPKSSSKDKKKKLAVEEEEIEVPEKVRRKRKAEDLDVSLEPPKKVKKESANMWTSELSIEKSLFELPVKSPKKKSIK